MGQQLVCGQIARLAAVEDRLSDVRSEKAEANEPREIRRAYALPLGQCCIWHAVAVEECGMKSVRPDQQLNEPCISLRRRKRVRAVDPHRDLPPGAAQPH